jgi:hypothetical protein
LIRNDIKKCVWREPDDDEGWQPKCSPDDGYISGDLNDLREMKSTYTYCPKCGKEIDFISQY